MRDESFYKDSTIVVVDDLEQVLSSIRLSLEFEGMNVITFKNPIEGLNYLKTNKADVLLLDFFMPEMNGDEFVERLRKFNQETIVILQTGYSDKIPPLEMIDKLNIQGYLDKNKGEDELLLMTKAAIKTSFLNKSIREKEQQIVKLSYKKAIIGDLITHLINESKDQLFQIEAMNESIKNASDEYKDENKIIDNATKEIFELYNALNFENEKNISMGQLEKTLKELLKAKLLLNKVPLSINIKNQNDVIENKADELIYAILETIDLIMKMPVTKIVIEVYKENNIVDIEIRTDTDISNINVEQLSMANENVSIKVNTEEKDIKISMIN